MPIRTMDIRNLSEVSAFQTKDGSEIRELLADHRAFIWRSAPNDNGLRMAG